MIIDALKFAQKNTKLNQILKLLLILTKKLNVIKLFRKGYYRLIIKKNTISINNLLYSINIFNKEFQKFKSYIFLVFG